RRRLKELTNKKNLPHIVASDISDVAIEIAKSNAKTAGVEHLITFEVGDFAKTTIPEGNGVIMFNPEYGERLGTHSKLEATYKRIGDFMKQECRGYRGYVFTGNLDLAKKIGLQASRRFEFFSGKLDCRLLQYELYEGSKERPGTVVTLQEIPERTRERYPERRADERNNEGIEEKDSDKPTDRKIHKLIRRRD